MWVSALVIGLAGSFHCLGMCSPLALAVTTLRKPFLINRLVYNGGRIFTYGLLGALISSVGSLFRLSDFQDLLTISLGAVLIIMGLTGSSQIRIPVLTGIIQKVATGLKTLFSQFLKERTILSISILGMLNGFLPCGLTYLALSYCLTLPHAGLGFLFMLMFGAGTLPVMLGFTSVVQMFYTRFGLNVQKFSTIAMIALGALLITRSLYVHYHEGGNFPVESSIVICR